MRMSVLLLLTHMSFGFVPSGAARVARPQLWPRRTPGIALEAPSRDTLISAEFLNKYVFKMNIEEAKSVNLTRCLAAGEYHRAGDLIDVNPDSLEARLRILGVRESHSDALCNWSAKQRQARDTKQRQARDRSLPGLICTLDSRPGRQTPRS